MVTTITLFGSRKEPFHLVVELVALRAIRRHGSDAVAESCAAGTGVAGATDGGNPTAASTDAAAGTSASADATAPAGLVHFQQQQQESAVEDERVRTPALRSFLHHVYTDGGSVCHVLFGSSSQR